MRNHKCLVTLKFNYLKFFGVNEEEAKEESGAKIHQRG